MLRHELAHYLAFHVLVRQPRWLAEGLATYLQTVVVGTYQGKPAAAVGLPPRTVPLDLLGAEPASVGKLLRGEDLDYLWSGLLVHWLVNQRSDEFADYQQRLARAEEPMAA